MKRAISDKIDHLFRHEYGKLVSVLTKTFGTSNIGLAEDVVQEAMLEALNKWSYDGVPTNAVGWIYKVAKYKAVNILNKEKYKRQYSSEIAHHLQSEWTVEPTLKHIFTDKEIVDDQLRMIFTCCNPIISTDSQVALTLKTLCGFSIPEIAKAFLTNEENINKRLVRARRTIKDANTPFEVPTGKELEARLASVLETIYLLFNEGYNASSGDNLVRLELCEEAIRLAEIIASNPNIKSSNIYALLALMTLNTSRFNSRMDEFDNLLDLEHQQRSQWDKELIKKGLYYLEFAAHQNEVSIYHILATISALHCTASDYKSTDWISILHMYDMLIEIDKSPIVLLNRAVVISKTSNPKKALEQLEKIKDNSTFHSYLPYYTTKAELHFRNNQQKIAIELLNRALKLPIGKNHKSFINKRLQEYSEIK
jgi:RNA polymerase sigma-70 factor (ECF subfamily)